VIVEEPVTASDVDVAPWSEVPPSTVSVEFALSAEAKLRTPEMVVEPLTANALVVAPVNVALVPVRVAIVAAPNVAPPSALN